MTVRDRLHLGAVAPEQERAILVVAQLAPQLGDFRDEARLLDRVLDRGVERDFAQPLGIVRLDDVVGGAEADRFDDRRRLLAARQHDRLQVGLRRLQRAQRFEAVHARHHHVEQHDVGRIALLDRGEQSRRRANRSASRSRAARGTSAGSWRTRNRHRRWRRKAFSTLQLRKGERDDGGASGTIGVVGCCGRWRPGDQMPSAVAFDDAARERQRQAEAAALFVERHPGARRMPPVRSPSSATTTTAGASAVHVSRRRSATTVAGPACSRRIARKIASNAVRRRVGVARVIGAPSVARELPDARRDPSPHAHARPLPRRARTRRTAALRELDEPRVELAESR